MKKIFSLIMLIALIMMGITSCSVDDNPVPQPLKAGFTVDATKMYEQLGKLERVQQLFADYNDMSMALTVLVYDTGGKLVGKYETQSKNIGNMTVTADQLPNGTYTMVAYQRVVEDAFGDAWLLANEENLADAIIRCKYQDVYDYLAIGMQTKTITVKGGVAETLDIKPAGTILHFAYDDLTSDYKANLAAVYSQDPYYGFYLDPNRSGIDHFWRPSDVNELSWKQVAYEKIGDDQLAPESANYDWFVFDPGKHLAHIILYTTGDAYQNIYLEDSLDYSRDNGVYYNFNSWNKNDMYFGDASNWEKFMKEKDQFVFDEPLMKWGCNYAEVQTFMNDTSSHALQPIGEYNRSYMVYYPYYKAWLSYCFDGEAGESLYYAQYVIAKPELSLETITYDFVHKGYKFVKINVTGSNTEYIYVSADGKTEICVFKDADYWIIQWYAVEAENQVKSNLAIRLAHDKLVRKMGRNSLK